MLYTSTRDQSVRVSSAEAIARGLSAEGGLFVPLSIPALGEELLRELTGADYVTRAAKVLSLYLTDFTEEELRDYASKAYGGGKFSHPDTAPLVKLSTGEQILELWHGPTSAFKDMALQMLPHLLTGAVVKTGEQKKVVILTATSGDTGKAALEGFMDVEGTEIIVFYPSDGVSPMQKRQMITQEGKNVFVSGIQGNFDDAQTGVKRIFTDPAMKEKLADSNMMFSSANSINWGRLVPQIVYYISAYCDLLAEGTLSMGDPIDVVVPTGNFGNILSAYYAMRMGLPVRRLVCASNANNVLTDFIETGVYDKNRSFYHTLSPSMDILVSSNLERLLYHLTDGDAGQVSDWMGQLGKTGRYQVTDGVRDKISALFAAGYCDDEQTQATIRQVWQQQRYLPDTHTAVAIHVCRAYRGEGQEVPVVLASTASPYKFAKSVLEAVSDTALPEGDEFAVTEQLAVETEIEIPLPLRGLGEKTVRFDGVCDKEDMSQVVLKYLGIEK